MGPLNIFPEFAEPRDLLALEVHDLDWHEYLTIVCLQGLINRGAPRLYLVNHQVDDHWLTYYRDRFGLPHTRVPDPMNAVRPYLAEIEGYVIYDDSFLDSANIAATIGALRNAIPVAPHLEGMAKDAGLRKVDDLRGRWADRVDAYRWAFRELWPECNKRIVGSLCTDYPYSQFSGRHGVREYLVAAKSFIYHLSSARKDRRERELIAEILAAGDPMGCVLGWHPGRDQEKEYVALAAEHGFFVLCSVGAPNMSVHAGMKGDPQTWKQRKLDPAHVEVEDKVYVTFYCTDGDAVWAMTSLQGGAWEKPERGAFPFNWGKLPLMVDLAPAQLTYFYETKSENDYFAGPSSGLAYTYSFLHPDARTYLEYSREYLQKSGQDVVNMVNWDTNLWWREVENDEAIALEQEVLGEQVLGMVCGLGGSTFARSYIDGPIPKVHACTLVGAGTDVPKQVRDLVACIDQRPLFLFVFAQIGDGMIDSLARGVPELERDDAYRVVFMDEFMIALKKAVDEGRITELYPKNEKLRDHQLREWGREDWANVYTVMERFATLCAGPDEGLLKSLNEGPWQNLAAQPAGNLLAVWEQTVEKSRGWEKYRPEELADAAGYTLVYLAWAVMRAAMNVNGEYANHFSQCVDRFCNLCSHIPDVAVMEEIWELWQDWEQRTLSLDEVKALTHRVMDVTARVNQEIG